ncbi:hypothetical protein AWV80_35515 [Cupriavidus sp. UYMU48A]|nr:hypothetical protein AWV80_35515 [Cupriavidus sp. UYMU48A]
MTSVIANLDCHTPEDADDGFFGLAGTSPSWIWVHTCPTPGCPCRTALALATHDGRGILEARGAPVRQAWMSKGKRYRDIADNVAQTWSDLVVFDLDIDTAQALQPPNSPLDLTRHSDVAAVVAQIDGERSTPSVVSGIAVRASLIPARRYACRRRKFTAGNAGRS